MTNNETRLVKDYFNMPLEIGDKVLMVETGTRNDFVEGRITKITPCFVIGHVDQTSYIDGFRRTGEQLIKIWEGK